MSQPKSTKGTRKNESAHLRYSIKTILFCMVGFSIVLTASRALWISYFKPYYKDARIASEIEKLGGRVSWRGPTVTTVYARQNFGDGISWTDNNLMAAMPHINRFENVGFIDLSMTQITEKGLENLRDNHNLTKLWLPHKTTDTGLQHLNKLTELIELRLYYSQVSDAGLFHLKNMTKLRILDLGDSKIRGTGFVHLSKLHRLQSLNLRSAPIEDSSLSFLENFPDLVSLDLGRTKVSDKGVAQLSSNKNLKYLYLDGTRVTDDCVTSLVNLKKLTHLYMNISDEAASRLSHPLPGLEINGVLRKK